MPLQAGRAGHRGMIIVRVMSFAGCLFHSWKQNYVLPVPESCKPTSILCHCLAGGQVSVGHCKGLCAESREVSSAEVCVPGTIFKHDTAPWARTSSSQRHPLQQLKSCLGKTTSLAVLGLRLEGAECDGARWCKATAISPKMVSAALEDTNPQQVGQLRAPASCPWGIASGMVLQLLFLLTLAAAGAGMYFKPCVLFSPGLSF